MNSTHIISSDESQQLLKLRKERERERRIEWAKFFKVFLALVILNPLIFIGIHRIMCILHAGNKIGRRG